MAEIEIIEIEGTLLPSAITEPTHRSELCEGGWHSVSTFNELLTIPSGMVLSGMAGYVVDESQLYTLSGDYTLRGSWTKPVCFGNTDFDSATVGQSLVYDGYDWVPYTIGTDGIADFTILGNHILSRSISGTNMSRAISGGHIPDNAITTDKIQDGTITSYNIDGEYLTTLGVFLTGEPSASIVPSGDYHGQRESSRYFAVGSDYLYVTTRRDGFNHWYRTEISDW